MTLALTPKDFFQNKKVLVMGLGLLGGGIAATKWLVKHGAKVTVTDLKTKKELADSIKALEQAAKKAKSRSEPTKEGSTTGIKLVLGRHDERDFRTNDIIVINPAVPKESPYLKIALQNKAQLENEASLFFRFCKNPIIGVTGTRGKTTTVNWIHHFLKQKFPGAVLTGNSSDHPMLKALDQLDGRSPVTVELSSWHLELLPQSQQAPHIAVITNLYPDHLNRYRDIKEYAQAKTNIFKHQTKNDFLILNKNNNWTKFFLKQKPQGQTKYASLRSLASKLGFIQKYGQHNLENLLTASTAAHLAGADWSTIKKSIATLPQIKFRQEVIYDKNGLTIINDATATSPDATIAALKRFGSQDTCLILLTGGTDKNLKFDDWAKAVKKYTKKENLFLLKGSATKKMITALAKIKYFRFDRPNLFDDFNTLLTAAFNHAKLKKQIPLEVKLLTGQKSIVLFSPSGASFEKFKNEFDRGERFNVCLRTALAGRNYKH